MLTEIHREDNRDLDLYVNTFVYKTGPRRADDLLSVSPVSSHVFLINSQHEKILQLRSDSSQRFVIITHCRRAEHIVSGACFVSRPTTHQTRNYNEHLSTRVSSRPSDRKYIDVDVLYSEIGYLRRLYCYRTVDCALGEIATLTRSVKTLNFP